MALFAPTRASYPAVAGLGATLRQHVVRVVPHGPQEQMVWTDTSRGVAAMKHAHAGRNRAVVQFPREAMASDSAGCARADTYVPVSLPVAASHPQPAAFGLVDVGPKALSHRAHLSWLSRSLNVVRARPLSFVATGFVRVVVLVCGTSAYVSSTLGLLIGRDHRLSAVLTARRQPCFLGRLLKEVGQWLWPSTMGARRVGTDLHWMALTSLTRLGAA